MKLSNLFIVLVLALVIFGCSSTSTSKGYVCPSGYIVDNPSQCNTAGVDNPAPGGTTADLRVAYAKHAVTKIAEAADTVYAQGSPAKFSIYVTIPDNAMNATVQGHSISIGVSNNGSPVDVSEQTVGEVRGCIKFSVPGTHRVTVEAIQVESKKIVQITDGEGCD